MYNYIVPWIPTGSVVAMRRQAQTSVQPTRGPCASAHRVPDTCRAEQVGGRALAESERESSPTVHKQKEWKMGGEGGGTEREGAIIAFPDSRTMLEHANAHASPDAKQEVVPRASLQVRHVDSKHSKPGREAASIIFANREIGYLRTHTLPEKHLTPPAVKGENVHRQNLVLVLEARPINVLDTLCTQTTISQDAKRRLNHFSSDASNTCALGASSSGSTKCGIDQGSANASELVVYLV
eukprot:CAMPEP_0183603220 /NCGR_PEP_ID=MMETSP0371-20130417/181337_1 /TAXON_ID=268820 /ORGANISM="Peridinium aciculiferum, Strain PAER-2" /LENGTH=238 /DNA_ID=CAMNT_0025815317 /DNA_START=32 /DNA_END=749 /DNA_ORIENTATION=-